MLFEQRVDKQASDEEKCERKSLIVHHESVNNGDNQVYKVVLDEQEYETLPPRERERNTGLLC